MTTTPPTTMSCIAIPKPGGPEALVPEQRPVPKPGPGQVLIKVAAAGVNRPDVIQRQGHYPPPLGASDLPGLEVAGSVVSLGPDVTTVAEDDTVCALLGGGGYAAYAVADAALCLPLPKDLSIIEAAALPETALTVWHNVVERGGLRAGETLLVHGGSSGIGTMAIQVAKALGGRVITTAGSDEKIKACLALGADVAVNYRSQDFVNAVMEVTEGKGCDVVLDMVGGAYVPRNLKALAADGRHVSIAFLQGSKMDLNLMPVMLKRLTLTGSTLRSRSLAFKTALAKSVQQNLWPLVEAGKVKPVIHSILPLDQASAAHRLMESSTHIGKIMLTP